VQITLFSPYTLNPFKKKQVIIPHTITAPREPIPIWADIDNPSLPMSVGCIGRLIDIGGADGTRIRGKTCIVGMSRHWTAAIGEEIATIVIETRARPVKRDPLPV
jgi:hypothetical protein